MSKGKNVLTTGDVARICNVAPRTVSKWFDSGQLRGYRIPGSRDRRIPLSELVRFMKANNMPAADALVLGKKRILIVDSDPAAANALADGLRTYADYDVQVVCTSFETGVTAQKFAPHVLLINLLAKDIDVKGICDSIRKNEDLQTIKIIAVANKLNDSETTALLRKGFDACLPCTPAVNGLPEPQQISKAIKLIEDTTAIVY
jgi:excisionase family DNA binding protein